MLATIDQAPIHSPYHLPLTPRPRNPMAGGDSHPAAGWLVQAFDEIDYGLLLVRGHRVLHLNHVARIELDQCHPLQVQDQQLHVDHPDDATRLNDALAGVNRGLRRLVTLGRGEQRVGVAVVPLRKGGADGIADPPVALLTLGKRQVCEPLSVQWFARSHALTPAESRVLEALCRGTPPREMADTFGVGLATVRTQISSIRAKTGADSIRDLVRQVTVLPPMLPALRSVA